MQNLNNDITITEEADSTEITIQFKKTVYSSTIWMHIIVVLILATVGLSILISSILHQSFDGDFFLIFWVFLVFFLAFMDYKNILWLKKGKEVIAINSKQIILQKIFPAHKLYGADENTTIIISTSDLKRVYYSRYIPFRNSLPSKSKGNLHFQDQKQKYSFAINLNQQECTPIIRLIKQKIPNIETNV